MFLVVVGALLSVVYGVPQTTGTLQNIRIITVLITLTGHLNTAKPAMMTQACEAVKGQGGAFLTSHVATISSNFHEIA